MAFYRVIAIPEELADQARAALKSPQYGHPAHIEIATGYGPCRSCLRTFQEGEEERILFTYDPFAGLDSYPSPGPVFIHREGCPRYEEAGFPEGIRRLPLTLEAYGRGRWLVARERVAGGDVDGSVGRLFSHPAVEYIHVRNTEAGCYIARIERADEAHTAN
ncbi:MAG TPA: DUF1203 domain-containing protein [Thermoanaerobaculia bacterium]|nr:DUF1203 domain-containing protein [Thermoanaerobaculia bacterium]